MNENDPKPGVVIDVTPEHEPEPETARGPAGAANEPARETPARAPGSTLERTVPLVLALVALVVAGVAAVYSYRQSADLAQTVVAAQTWIGDLEAPLQRLGEGVDANTAALAGQGTGIAELDAQLAAQRLRVDEALAAFGQQEQRLVGENLRLQEREAELRAAVADVHRRVGRSGTQWMIAEAEYLLRIASHRLNLARDGGSARVALELADQRLRDTRDPGWAGVREQIARDIARLAAFDEPDVAGLSARLGAVIEQVPRVKVARATIGAERTLPERVAREPGERSWDTLLDDLWSGFKDSVRIRERDNPVQAMLAPEHQFFLYENLKLHLEAARLALARHDPALYQDNLAVAADWLARYFDPEDPVARAVAKAITELRTVDVRPELPDISHSLRALQVRQKLLEDLAPAAGEAS
jgi:uroporphyrin-3 C-methyltransferase